MLLILLSIRLNAIRKQSWPDVPVYLVTPNIDNTCDVASESDRWRHLLSSSSEFVVYNLSSLFIFITEIYEGHLSYFIYRVLHAELTIQFFLFFFTNTKGQTYKQCRWAWYNLDAHNLAEGLCVSLKEIRNDCVRGEREKRMCN